MRGWALYWRSLYDHLLARMSANASLDDACLLVAYDALCAEPAAQIDRVLEHAGLDAGGFEAVREEYIERLSPPGYYQPDFSDDELQIIREITGPTARRLGVGMS